MTTRTTPGPEFFLEAQPRILALAQRFDDLKNPAIITDPDANIIWTNRAILERTGFSREEALGRNPAALWGGQMPKEFYEWMWHTIKTEKRVFVNKLVNRNKLGKKYWQYIYIAPILDATGNIRYFIAFEFDAENPTEEELFVNKLAPAMDAQQSDPSRALTAFLSLVQVGGESADVKGLVGLVRELVTAVAKQK
ncbi:MAG TPA: PAS domain-containing protein [Candidatus Paceibacterota bacterium]|nr:PAS domain-containing protein [Candidatus Paceibacterota bacterium]